MPISSLSRLVVCARFLACLSLAACAVSAAGPASPSGSSPTSVPPPGFTALFNGRDLAGWRGYVGKPKERAALAPAELTAAQIRADEDMRAHWRVERDVLVHDGKGQNLVSEADFDDFELLVDWKIAANGDGGVYLRGLPQVQIWDPANPAEQANGAAAGSGALWNNKKAGNRPRVRADRPIGAWNSLRVRMVGEIVWIWLNGQLVVDHVRLENAWERGQPVYARGPIELQTHGHPLWFRNVFVRKIPSSEATALLGEADEKAFVPVWNGKDFTGWQGEIENYEIVDGAIRCKKGKGGTIFTSDEFADFVVRLEFKLPPAGNNGLALRYPGSGDAAYVGMCELQVLDTEHPKYTKLDPRQAHGSAYGMAAAHRGFLRPVGEWNWQQVTVKGSTIVVELNGTTILETDLAGITEFLDHKAHPGKDRTSGHFGFAGHSDPVAFRNVRIRSL